VPGASRAKARRAKQAVAALLAGDDAVNGVGIAPVPGGYAVRVNLARPLAAGSALPATVEGVPVIVVVVGVVDKQQHPP
jgi:hypothetical protein